MMYEKTSMIRREEEKKRKEKKRKEKKRKEKKRKEKKRKEKKIIFYLNLNLCFDPSNKMNIFKC
jgi:hypothetical protein